MKEFCNNLGNTKQECPIDQELEAKLVQEEFNSRIFLNFGRYCLGNCLTYAIFGVHPH